MTLHRFFLDRQLLSRETEPTFALALREEDARHAMVLRLRPGEHIAVIDGAGDYFECEIVSLDNAPIVRIAAHEPLAAPAFSMALCIGMPKGTTLDDIVRAATELGVDRLLPFTANRSVARLDAARGARRTQRWATIARNAAMQSGRDRIPTVTAPQTLDELCEAVTAFDGLLVCWEEADGASTVFTALDELLVDRPATPPTIGLVIGPEGGLDEQEVAALRAAQPRSQTISLGPQILRVETAALSSLALLGAELTRRLGP